MFKKIFFQAILASLLAFIAAVIYKRIYFFATEADFSKVLSMARMAGLCILFACRPHFYITACPLAGQQGGAYF